MAIELQSREFSQGEGPTLLVTGAVHGDEFEGVVAIRRLISFFESNPEFAGTVHLVPIVNEAAFLRGHRTAEDNLDLARVCPGDPDGSETMQVAHAVSGLIREADYYIDLHTGGTELSVMPLAGYMLVENEELLDQQRRIARAFNLPLVWGTNPAGDGRTLSVARDAGVPAIYAEYLGSATMSQEGVSAYVDGCLRVMNELGILKHHTSSSAVKYTVEDTRPDSGHMQISDLSPLTGYYETEVGPGDLVQKGQLLGIVSSLRGDQKYELHAEYDGLVAVVRTFPRVREGETLGLVIELET